MRVGLVFCFSGTAGISMVLRVRGGCIDWNARGIRGAFSFIAASPPALSAMARDGLATATYIAVIAADIFATAIYSSATTDYSVAIVIYISAIDADGFVITTCSVATAIYTPATNTDGVAIDADSVATKAVPIERIANISAIAGYNTQLIPYS